MARRQSAPPTVDPAAARAADPLDRVGSLLEHADDATDVIQFFEENAAGRWMYIERFDAPDVRAIGLEEFIQQRYGGGRYRAGIRARASNKYGPSVTVAIAGAKKSDHERAAQHPQTGAAAAPAAPSAPNNNPPSWMEKIILPLGVTMATAFGSLLAKKLLETPAPDPVLLELVKRGNKPATSDAMNPLELMKLVGDAEERGERRGREVGKLAARADGDGGSGVGSAIQDALPLFSRMIDAHERQAGARPPLANAQLPTSPAPAATPAADIIPAWLRPLMRYKMFILDAADAETIDAEPLAGMVVRNSDEATWAAIVDAEAAGRLETDIFAALPELGANDRRKAFVTAVVGDLRESIHAPSDEEESEAAGNG